MIHNARKKLPSMLAVLVVAGCQAAKEPAEPASTTKATGVDRVTASQPLRKSLQLVTDQPGRVAAYEEAPIVSKLAGYVEAVLVDIGDQVTKGQVLIRLDAPEYKDQLQQKRGLLLQAEAQVKQFEAALLAAEATVHSAKSQVVQMEAAVGRSEAEVVRWSSENQRIQQLVNKGTVTPKLAEETTSQFKAAEAGRKEVQASIEAAKAKQREAEANVVKAQADIEAAKAKLAVAQADIDQAQTMLQYTELRAPFDGYITARRVDPGHYVQPAGASNQQPLVSVANLGTVRVFVDVPESEAAYVNDEATTKGQGDQATISSPTLHPSVVAPVTRTGLQLDAQSRALTVEIDVPNTLGQLRPGSFVNVKVRLEQRENVLVLPLGAIVKKGAETYCCLVSQGKIVHQPIELGLRVGDEVEVRNGLTGQETVVMLRAGVLQADQPVEVIVKK